MKLLNCRPKWVKRLLVIVTMTILWGFVFFLLTLVYSKELQQ